MNLKCIMYNHNMAALKLRIIFIQWICVLSGCTAQISIATAPVNEALLRTGNVTLECKVSQPEGGFTTFIHWEECITIVDGSCRRISTDENNQYALLDGDAVRGARYSIRNPEQKKFDLVITGVLLEDGGQYRCLAVDNANTFKYAEVIVLDSGVSCTRNTTIDNEAVEGEFVMMTCEVTYSGRWQPMMNWKVNSQGYTGNINDETTGSTVRKSIVVEVVPDNNQDAYSMDLNFAAPADTQANEATNAPSYVDSHTYPPLTVFFKPQSISVSPNQGSFQPGDTKSCSAVANPTAQYIWTDTHTSEPISQTADIIITTDMLGSQTYMCRAYNQYGNDTAKISFNVYTTTTTTTTTTSPPTTTTSTEQSTSHVATPGGSGGTAGGSGGTGGVSLSAAAIGGISGAVVFVIIIVFVSLVIYIIRLKKQLKKNPADVTATVFGAHQTPSGHNGIQPGDSGTQYEGMQETPPMEPSTYEELTTTSQDYENVRN